MGIVKLSLMTNVFLAIVAAFCLAPIALGETNVGQALPNPAGASHATVTRSSLASRRLRPRTTYLTRSSNTHHIIAGCGPGERDTSNDAVLATLAPRRGHPEALHAFVPISTTI